MNKKILKPKHHEPSRIIIRVGEWVRETGKPTGKRPLPAPGFRKSSK